MRELNLYKLWEVLNTLSRKQEELSEDNIYVLLMGHRSNYVEMSFEGFLEYYAFKVNRDTITVYNDDGVSFEDYENDDFSYVPICLLSFSAEKLENWIDDEIEKQLAQQKREKEQQKENIKSQIERLKTQLNNL